MLRTYFLPVVFPLVLCLFSFNLTAYGQHARITLSLKNVPLLTAMDSIQQHSGYRFSYSLGLTPQLKQTRVTIHAKGDPIEKILDILFDKNSIQYRIVDNMVLLSKVEPPKKETQPELVVLVQTVKGRVVDRESHAPVPGVSIIVMNDPENRGTITDSNGTFSLKVPVGLQSLRCTNVGYQEYMAADIRVVSGKQTLLTIEMQEAAKTMETVTVNATERRDRSLNAMATVSSRMLRPEDAGRFAGGYNDPARMVSALPGVLSGGDGRNNLIIRGNSPKGVLWKLEGVEIPSPNHFSRGQGDGGGIFTILTADMLSDFDFFTGAFPAEYGNALSGIMDLNLRKGNPDKREYGVEVGMIGTQLSAEGPISKNNKSSYLFHYRYGNLRFLDNLDLISLDENEKPPIFQDFSMNINIPTKKAGNFSLFGFGGISETGTFRSPDSTSWSRNTDARNEETETHQIGVLGLKHTLQLPNKRTYLKSVLSFSWQSDRFVRHMLDDNLKPLMDDSNRYAFPTLRFSTAIHHKLNAKNSIRAGFIYSHLSYDVYGKKLEQNKEYRTYLDQSGSTGLAEGFFQWKHRLLERLEINTGIHATAFLLNDNYMIEPRFGAKWNVSSNASLNYGFGMHSRIEPIFIYYLKKKEANGSYTQPNLNLKPTKAMHHVLGYDVSLSKNFRLKLEAYYQYLYDVPVADDTGSTAAILNSLDKLPDSAYVNKGKGFNKGIELTLEKFFSDDYYFLVTGSVFDSKYQPANGKKYNTYFNTGYQANALIGKDFRVGNRKQNIFSVNLRSIVHGGFRYSTAALTTENGIATLYYPTEGTYSMQAPRFIRFDTGLKFRKNNRRYSWILSLDIQNFTNRKNILYYNYGMSPDQKLVRNGEEDLGIIPILNLKVEF